MLFPSNPYPQEKKCCPNYGGNFRAEPISNCPPTIQTHAVLSGAVQTLVVVRLCVSTFTVYPALCSLRCSCDPEQDMWFIKWMTVIHSFPNCILSVNFFPDIGFITSILLLQSFLFLTQTESGEVVFLIHSYYNS